jgi:hypothetical protein
MNCHASAPAASEAVYFYRTTTGKVRIGHSGDVEGRIGTHRSSDPDITEIGRIQTHNHQECETFLKRILEGHRVPGTKEFFEMTDDEVELAREAAMGYLQHDLPLAATVEPLKDVRPEQTVRPATEEAVRIAGDVRSLKESKNRIEIQLERAENQLRVLIGADLRIDGVATWGGFDKLRLDVQGLKDKRPEIYEQYCVTDWIRRLDLD